LYYTSYCTIFSVWFLLLRFLIIDFNEEMSSQEYVCFLIFSPPGVFNRNIKYIPMLNNSYFSYWILVVFSHHTSTHPSYFATCFLKEFWHQRHTHIYIIYMLFITRLANRARGVHAASDQSNPAPADYLRLPRADWPPTRWRNLEWVDRSCVSWPTPARLRHFMVRSVIFDKASTIF
jgi:hypothetical protein